MSEVTGRSREDPMPEGRRPRGVTPTPKVRGSGQEYQTAKVQEGPRGVTPRLRLGRGGGREEIRHASKPEARGGGREEPPHTPTPEAKGGGRKEQPHAQGQGRWLGGPSPSPRSHGCAGAGGPRGAISR